MVEDIKILQVPIRVQDKDAVLEVIPEDIQALENRIEEIERYLGIQDMDLDYFLREEGEDLNQKSQLLDDFIASAEDKIMSLKDMYLRFEKMESFLKNKEPFTQQCMDLKRKNNFIID